MPTPLPSPLPPQTYLITLVPLAKTVVEEATKHALLHTTKRYSRGSSFACPPLVSYDSIVKELYEVVDSIFYISSIEELVNGERYGSCKKVVDEIMDARFWFLQNNHCTRIRVACIY
jgi:hypothetical protein